MVITYDQERALVRKMFTAYGLSERDAGIISESLTQADFTGVESHGLSRATMFMRQLRDGMMNKSPDEKVLLNTDTLYMVDCDNGSGIVSMTDAYCNIMPKAKAHGIALATGKHSANIGCGNYYAWKAAQDGMILLACCNTYRLMAPYGGADPMIGSNPIIISAPAGDKRPVVFDIATTFAAAGKIIAAKRKNTSIPDNWCLNKDGNRTTDPNEYYTLLPFGGYKGYGFAVMVDILSAVMNGAAYGNQIGEIAKDESENSGWTLILMDPSKFMPLDEFKLRMDDYIGMMKECRKADGVDEIFLPGEIEFNTYAKRITDGFYVNEPLQNQIMDFMRQAGVAGPDCTFEDFVIGP